MIKDIAPGGAFINTRRNIDPDQPVSIRFPTLAFQNRFHVTGMFVRSDDGGFAVMFNEPIEEKICQEGRFPGILSERDRVGDQA